MRPQIPRRVPGAIRTWGLPLPSAENDRGRAGKPRERREWSLTGTLRSLHRRLISGIGRREPVTQFRREHGQSLRERRPRQEWGRGRARRGGLG